jgi:hypothetical protein
MYRGPHHLVHLYDSPVLAAAALDDGQGDRLMGALVTAAVAVLIAALQRHFQIRDRWAERRERRRAAADKERRIGRRATWEPEFKDIRTLLISGRELTWQILNNGPYSSAELVALGVDTFAMRAEQLAERGPEALREDLTDLVELAKAVKVQGLDGPQAAQPGAVVAASYRAAIGQDRAALRLDNALKATLHHLRAEWGSDRDGQGED